MFVDIAGADIMMKAQAKQNKILKTNNYNNQWFKLQLPKTEVTSTPTRPTGQKQQLFDGRTVENKGKLILTEIFQSVQKCDI